MDTEQAGAQRKTLPTWMRIFAATVALALAVIIVAPVVLSSQDLVRWAQDPTGLGLPKIFAWLTFVALDSAAVVCVGMVSVAAWRGETGGAFHALTWMFALGSATANYRHGQITPARDDEYFFPAMSLAGPLLLDVTLARIRRWARIDAATQLSARPKFGLRWLPGVGFRSTLSAWQAALRENISKPSEALAYTREVDALRGLDHTDALRFAWQALGDTDPYTAWRWLVARGVHIDWSTVQTAAADRAPVSQPKRTAAARTTRTTVVAKVDQAERTTGPDHATTPTRDPGPDQPNTGPETDRTNVVHMDRDRRTTTDRIEDDPLWTVAVEAARTIRDSGSTVSKRSMAPLMRADNRSCNNDRLLRFVAALKNPDAPTEIIETEEVNRAQG